MGYWLKSFNTEPYPVPGKSFTVPQIDDCKHSFLKRLRSQVLTESSATPHDCHIHRRGLCVGLALRWALQWQALAIHLFGGDSYRAYQVLILSHVFTADLWNSWPLQ